MKTYKYTFTYTPANNTGNIRIHLDKDNTNTSTETQFYVDYITFTRGKLEIIEESNYYPFGLKHKGYNSVTTTLGNSVAQKFGFNGKELNLELGLEWHDFGARNYDAALGRWMNLDPLAEKFETYSPYNAMMNNPIMFIDPDGRAAAPIYDTDGEFLGTDDQGLQGKAIVMDKESFEQGMSHEKALTENKGAEGLKNGGALNKLLIHKSGLKDRPDWDGFVTIDEGIDWAKNNVGALNNPTADNMLYIDASKLDFGNISVGRFISTGSKKPMNLFNNDNVHQSIYNSTLASTIYALGRVNMILNDRTTKSVSIVNDKAVDYDWNYGDGIKRNTFMFFERLSQGLNDSHGFKVSYYGKGKLNQ